MCELVKLQAGTKIDKFIVGKILGEGGFGAVYEVKSMDGRERYALKVEASRAIPQVLCVEVYLLELLHQRGFLRHFCRIYGKDREGRPPSTFNYVVMSLTGKSLRDLRMLTPAQHFSVNCAIGVGRQSLEALEDLHSVGYLHRDVKPGNISVGRYEVNELHKVYMLDFGQPRDRAVFRGTLRYASIPCHMEREQSRDDLESWLYTLVETTSGKLSWAGKSKPEVEDWKKLARSDPSKTAQLFNGCPFTEYKEIMDHIDSLRYYDAPNYNLIYDALRRALTSRRMEERPYDWEIPTWPNVQIKRA